MIAGHKLAAEARGYVDGPHAGFLPRRLALSYPVTRAGLYRSAHFPNSNPCLGRPPSTCTARHGVEHDSGLRRAASHSRRAWFLVSTRNGRVLSDRQRSALQVNLTEP